MWVRNTCGDCGNAMALDTEIVLDAAIEAGELDIKYITQVKDVRLRKVTRLRDLFEEVKAIVAAEWGSEFSVQVLRSELLHKHLFSGGLIEDFIDELKLQGGYYERDGMMVAVA